MASYSYVFAQGRNLIVAQIREATKVLRFEQGADGRLLRGGSFSAPLQSVPMDVAFAAPDKAYVRLLFGGKVLAFDPRGMAVRGEIDFTGPQHAVRSKPVSMIYRGAGLSAFQLEALPRHQLASEVAAVPRPALLLLGPLLLLMALVPSGARRLDGDGGGSQRVAPARVGVQN